MRPMLKALCLGWVTDMLKVILALRGTGIDTVVVNTHPDRFFATVPALAANIPVALNLYQGVRVPKLKLTRFLLIANTCALGSSLSRRLRALIRSHQPDFAFAHWGVGMLPEVALVKSVAPELPIILNMETFPTAPEGGLREALEQKMFRRMHWALDGLIIPTAEMAQLVFSLAPSLRKKPYWVSPFYYPKEFAPARALPKLRAKDSRPHVIFAGQFDLRHSINDVRKEILSLAEVGIVVHCAATAGLEHPNVVKFDPFGGEELVSGFLTTFMTQFDACLVTYAELRCTPMRFSTSLPSRFLIALAAGLPMLLPGGRFGAMERFIKEQGIGFVYRDPFEAYEFLTSTVTLPRLEAISRTKASQFILQPKELSGFIERVIKCRA